MTEAENVPLTAMCGGAAGQLISDSRDISHYKYFVHGLPAQFVKSMRTLFDMLDDRGSGEVALSEIERRWRDDAVPNLPGVLEALRVVAPAKGLLTFDNFVNGLRLALSKSRHRHILREHNGILTGGLADEGLHHQSYDQFTSDSNSRPSAPSTTWAGIPPPSSSDRIRQTSEPATDKNPRSLESDSKPARRFRHRRSNSGPIYTARVLPNVKQPPEVIGIVTRDDLKLNPLRVNEDNIGDRFQLAESFKKSRNFFRDRVHRDLNSDIASSHRKLTRKATETASENKVNTFDQLTASTLFVDQDEEDVAHPVVSVQPVVVSGKYIGITGTLNRAKSTASIRQRRYASFHSPASKDGEEAKLQPVASSSLNSLSARQPCEHKSNEVETEFWKSESVDGSSGFYRKRAIEKGNRAPEVLTKSLQRDGYGRRCNSASPPDVPAVKSARSSRREDEKQMTKSVVHTSVTSPNSSTSSSHASSGNDDSNSASRRRANSASNAQRRRNARWNTAVVALDSPTMKFLKEIQQKQDLLTKGLESVNRLKICFEKGIVNIREERNRLNAKVESGATSKHPSSNLKEKSHLHRKLDVDLDSASLAIGSLGDVVKQFQSLSVSPGTDTSCNDEVSNLRRENKVLNKEVTNKAEEIRQLEREKAALVRQLFQARSELQQSSGSQLDTSIFI